MAPRMRFSLAGAAVLVVALISMMALVAGYWPFQSVVQVIAPFLVISILTSVGMTLLLTAFLLPRDVSRASPVHDATSALDSLLDEVRRRP